MHATELSGTLDTRLVDAVERARAAARDTASGDVGEYDGHVVDDDVAVTHFFLATEPGYVGWRWAVTLASAGPDSPVTVSETVLLPGRDALRPPPWVPWDQRVRAGDVGVGDLLPTAEDDPRLVPGYLDSDDPAVAEAAAEPGLGRVRVMSRQGRLDTAQRWFDGEFGPGSDMARNAPAACGTCGFYLPLAGSLRAAFGACGNEYSPADGAVVHTEYGCGAHSEMTIETGQPEPPGQPVYDDGIELLDLADDGLGAPGGGGDQRAGAGPAPVDEAEPLPADR